LKKIQALQMKDMFQKAILYDLDVRDQIFKAPINSALALIKKESDLSAYAVEYIEKFLATNNQQDFNNNPSVVLEIIQEVINRGYNVNDIWYLFDKRQQFFQKVFLSYSLRMALM